MVFEVWFILKFEILLGFYVLRDVFSKLRKERVFRVLMTSYSKKCKTIELNSSIQN